MKNYISITTSIALSFLQTSCNETTKSVGSNCPVEQAELAAIEDICGKIDYFEHKTNLHCNKEAFKDWCIAANYDPKLYMGTCGICFTSQTHKAEAMNALKKYFGCE